MESDSHSDEDLQETKIATDKINCKIIKMPYYPEQSSTGTKKKIKRDK